jgi:hypothetical protein
MKHGDLYLGEIIKSRGADPVEVFYESGSQPEHDPRVITFIVDYIREQDYLDVSACTDQLLYDKVKDYLERGVPAYLFMEEFEARYPVKGR